MVDDNVLRTVDNRKHPNYAATLDEVDSELSALWAERETLVAKCKVKKEALAKLEGALPFQWQQYKSKLISLIAIQGFEASVRQARRDVSLSLEQVYLCDMQIASTKAAACDARLASMPPVLDELLARREALLDAKARASATQRRLPSMIGALQRTRDQADVEDAELREKADARIAAQEHSRIAYSV